MKSLDHLKEAFAGESQAFQKYTAFAKKAEQEGFKNIAKLFKTTAEAEKIHAAGHLKAMEGIGSTAENLQAAIEGETYEFTEMYPPMYEDAVKENHKAKTMFKFALDAEKVHAELYKKALEAVKNGKDLDTDKIYLCPFCGYIAIEELPEKCPICNADKSKFVEID
ncbi:rubrerythrin family protein [Deferribacter thermophilus]|uniref:rubrerythrin family protein n=1 Tax=Deferribacter thermophilus TaxID=53573 RepID=UPI003C2E1A39